MRTVTKKDVAKRVAEELSGKIQDYEKIVDTILEPRQQY